ncbi:MAG: hypothetical protein KGZ53_02055 [Peptococcaceae bacterium]|nr:hypothetical protein [Peptococcaceae bacterium]
MKGFKVLISLILMALIIGGGARVVVLRSASGPLLDSAAKVSVLPPQKTTALLPPTDELTHVETGIKSDDNYKWDAGDATPSKGISEIIIAAKKGVEASYLLGSNLWRVTTQEGKQLITPAIWLDPTPSGRVLISTWDFRLVELNPEGEVRELLPKGLAGGRVYANKNETLVALEVPLCFAGENLIGASGVGVYNLSQENSRS